MTIRFRCPSGHLLSIGGEHAGKRLRCPKCLKISTVPHESLPAEPAPVTVTASAGTPAMAGALSPTVGASHREPALAEAASAPSSVAVAPSAAGESVEPVANQASLPEVDRELVNQRAAVPVAAPPQASGRRLPDARKATVSPPTLTERPPVSPPTSGDEKTAHTGSAASAPPVSVPPLPQRSAPPRLPQPESARPVAPPAAIAPPAPPIVAPPLPESAPPLLAAAVANASGGTVRSVVAPPLPVGVPPLPPPAALPPLQVPMARLAVVNPFAEDPREQAPVEFEGELKQAVDATAHHAPRATAIGYRPDRYKLQNVYLLAMGLLLVTLFGAAPALKFWDVSQAPDWARIVLLMTLVQFGFIAWMVMLPDWSTVWVSMLLFAAVATLYGVALAIAVMTPHGRPVALEMDDVRQSARLWCAAVILLTCSMTYLCGRMSHKWHKGYQLGR